MRFDAYEPVLIDAARLPDVPAEHHVPRVPWIACARAYCQSVSLQMIAEWRTGEEYPLGLVNWLMGFTYGAGHLKGSFVFLPYDDPEAGLRFAASFFGLEHLYLVTDDEAVYVQAAKTKLAAGLPVRIMLDSATLKGREDYFSPHSVVLVGYRGDVACVHETRMADKREREGVGQDVPWTTIAAAARKLSRTYRYPWVYQLTCFVPRPPRAPDAGQICSRNGLSLIGGETSQAATGAAALRSLAAELRASPRAPGSWDDLRMFLEYGIYTRADNAAFLEQASPALGLGAPGAVAERLTAASRCYAVMVAALAAGAEAARPAIVAALETAAALEQQAGELLCQEARAATAGRA